MRKYFSNYGYINCKPLTAFDKVAYFGYVIDQITGCWNWIHQKDKNGYGKLKYKNYQLAHRVSYLYHKGDPTGLEVCHHFDNPSCVNPDHLFLGTHMDNMQDAKNKQRFGIPQHPSISAYKQGCRCEDCKELNRVYKYNWKKQNAEKLKKSA